MASTPLVITRPNHSAAHPRTHRFPVKWVWWTQTARVVIQPVHPVDAAAAVCRCCVTLRWSYRKMCSHQLLMLLTRLVITVVSHCQTDRQLAQMTDGPSTLQVFLTLTNAPCITGLTTGYWPLCRCVKVITEIYSLMNGFRGSVCATCLCLADFWSCQKQIFCCLLECGVLLWGHIHLMEYIIRRRKFQLFVMGIHVRSKLHR